MTDGDQPYTAALNIDAPPSPDYVIELSETIAEAVRVLNHQTRHHEALEFPAEGDHLLRELSSAAARLPQLLDQIAGWYEREAAAGKLEAVSGEWECLPALAVTAIRMRADAARMTAEQLQADIASVAEVTSTLAAAETGDGTDDAG